MGVGMGVVWVGFGFLLSLVNGSAAAASPSRADTQAACAKMAQQGLPEWKKTDWSDVDAVGKGESKLTYELPVVFHVINHQPGFLGLGAYSMGEDDINDQLELVREAYNPCGIAIIPSEIHFWKAPEWLDELAGNEVNDHHLGDEERCLFNGVHRKDRVNVYFAGSVDGHSGQSHAWFGSFLNEELPGDRAFVGAVIISDGNRAGYSTSQAKRTVVAHEIGHVVLNYGHIVSNRYDLMANASNFLSLSLTRDQCETVRHSPFVRRR